MISKVPIEDSEIDSISSEIHNTYYPDNEKNTYQIVTIEEPYSIDYVSCSVNKEVLKAFTVLFRTRLLPKNKRIKTLVLFYLPENLSISFPEEFNGETITDNCAGVRFWLNKYRSEGKIWMDGEKINSSIPAVLTLLQSLTDAGSLSIISNKSEGELLFLPLSVDVGFLSDQYKSDRILFNSHFFLLEFSDLETKYDKIGESFGLLLINGKIINPPLYRRESLFINKDGSCRTYSLSIKDIAVKIGQDIFRDNENADFYIRPEKAVSPAQPGTDIAIIGRRIVGYKTGGAMEIPEAGFLIHLDRHYVPEILDVSFINEHDHQFGIQAGPLLINSSVPAMNFKDSYYNGEGIAFPPTVFPTCWNSGRAARLGFGFKENKLVLIWVEGSKPELYSKNDYSKGCSLAEFAQIAEELGIENFINLDGGGSSQLALGLKRKLRIADRYDGTGDDFERPVPLGLSIRINSGH
jgi:hypothetical protein